MASSLGICCGGGKCCGYNPKLNLKNHQTCASPSMVTMINHGKQRKGRVFAVSTSQELPPFLSSTSTSLPMLRQYSITREQKLPIAPEKLDEWMRESVTEIVKNLRQAPLLVHVYGGGDGNKGKRKMSMKMEKAVKEEIWPELAAQRPDGVIFVDVLDDASEEKMEVKAKAAEEETEVVVGVMVQGRGGAQCGAGPACYLLKTNRVGSACYFCLVKVKSFRETAKKQLEDCWLLRKFRNDNW